MPSFKEFIDYVLRSHGQVDHLVDSVIGSNACDAEVPFNAPWSNHLDASGGYAQ